MKRYEKVLLALLAATVSHDYTECLSMPTLSNTEWERLLLTASEQGVLALVYSTLEQLPKTHMPERKLLLKVIGKVMFQKKVYQHQFSTAETFAAALSEKGVEMKVLKGISFSTYYDQPALRTCGDCDCYLSISSTTGDVHSPTHAGASGFDLGNTIIEEIGGKYEPGGYKHSHLYLNSMLIENHHYITDFNNTVQGKKTEFILEHLIQDEPGTPIAGSHMVRPSAHFCALHCLRHAQGNLMLGGMTLRMLYDWTVIMRAEQSNMDWTLLRAYLDDMKLTSFAGVMTALCMRYLGLKVTAENAICSAESHLVDEVILETLRSDRHRRDGESFLNKVTRLFKRMAKVYHFRSLATEPFHVFLWNSLAFNSYTKRSVSLD